MNPEVSARKAALRKAILPLRQSISSGDRRHFADRLARIAVELLDASPRGDVAGYWPIRDEPDCLPMIGALTAAGFRTLLPAIVGGRATPLVFRAYRIGDPVAPGSVGAIPEPPPGRSTATPDILFIPCAAFDRAGGRIGFGQGYYDATLAALRARKPLVAIAVAFACQEVDEAPGEPHDQRLDAIITEREALFCTPTGKALDADSVRR